MPGISAVILSSFFFSSIIELVKGSLTFCSLATSPSLLPLARYCRTAAYAALHLVLPEHLIHRTRVLSRLSATYSQLVCLSLQILSQILQKSTVGFYFSEHFYLFFLLSSIYSIIIFVHSYYFFFFHSQQVIFKHIFRISSCMDSTRLVIGPLKGNKVFQLLYYPLQLPQWHSYTAPSLH